MSRQFTDATKLHPDNDRYQHLEISTVGEHITIVALHRPHARNAINAVMWREIGHAFVTLGALGDGCRVILLVGHGPSFCAGIDVKDESLFPTTPHEDDVAHTGLTFRLKLAAMQACLTAVETCPVPVVVAIHGHCIGAGIDLVCAADVRLCDNDATFAVAEVALGLAADVGTLQRLPKIVHSSSWVREVCLTGRVFDAPEALRVGLVSHVVPRHDLHRTALELCRQIAAHSPVAVTGTKEALVYARDHSVADGLRQIASYNALALQSRDVGDALQARQRQNAAVASFTNMPAHAKL